MNRLNKKNAKKKVLELMHQQYIRKTKDELIQTLLNAAKIDLENLDENNLHMLLNGLSKGKFGLDTVDLH